MSYNVEIKCIDFSDVELIENVKIDAKSADDAFRKAYYDLKYGKKYPATKYKVVSWKPSLIEESK